MYRKYKENTISYILQGNSIFYFTSFYLLYIYIIIYVLKEALKKRS